MFLEKRNISDLIVKYAVSSNDKQVILNDLIGMYDWSFDMDTEKLSFDSRFNYSVQILGTQSRISNTWMWAWANNQWEIPEKLLQMSYQIKDFGEKNSVLEFQQPQLKVNSQLNNHIFALIATGICNAKAYYIGNHENGSVAFLIDDEKYAAIDNRPLGLRICNVFTSAISQIEIIDHRLALIHYLEYLKLNVEEEKNTIFGNDQKKHVIKAEFNKNMTLRNIESVL